MSDDAATMLVVGDDTARRTFLAYNLPADGYDVLVADTARDALRLLERKYPDLALIDLGLPDGDGLALVERVRRAGGVATRVNPDVALVAVTARTAELDVLRGFERGVDDYLGKPFSYPELRGLISGFRFQVFGDFDTQHRARMPPMAV